MAAPIIQADNLGKQYRLRRQQTASYTALRDVLMERLKRPFRRAQASAATTEDFWALREVSFSVAPGETLGIIGRNGAGKSTLLKILSRITEPTTGRVRLLGRVASLLEVGTGFHPELTGRENVFLNGAILGMTRPEIRRKFDEIIAFAGVEKFLDTPVKHYSSGMYVRLAFAVAAHLEPEILIVDEVLAVGDAEFQRRCLGKLDDVAHKESRTIIFVSHNMDAVRRLCRSAILLREGRVECSDTTDRVIETYLSGLQGHESGAVIHYPEADPSQFHLERIEILDEAGALKPHVETWDTVRFRIVFHSPQSMQKGSVAFQIATLSGTVLALASTLPDQGVPVSFREGRNTVDLTIRRLSLAAGVYQFGAALAIPNVEVLCDGLEQGQLRVEPNDVYDSGLPPQSSRYLVPMEFQWQPI